MDKGNAAKTLLLAVLIIAGVLLNLMQWRNMAEERALLDWEKQQLAMAEERLATLRQLETRREELEANMDVLAQLLPVEALEDQLILDVQSGADLSNLRFKHIRFAERNINDEGYVEMPLQFMFEGGYHELLHFLDYLQVYERAVRVDELRVDKNEDNMTVNIRASAFYAAD